MKGHSPIVQQKFCMAIFLSCIDTIDAPLKEFLGIIDSAIADNKQVIGVIGDDLTEWHVNGLELTHANGKRINKFIRCISFPNTSKDRIRTLASSGVFAGQKCA